MGQQVALFLQLPAYSVLLVLLLHLVHHLLHLVYRVVLPLHLVLQLLPKVMLFFALFGPDVFPATVIFSVVVPFFNLFF